MTWPSRPSREQSVRTCWSCWTTGWAARSTLITSQLPTSAWHPWLGEPTIADAIMDRLLHGAHTLTLKGESLRRAKPQA